MKPSTCHPDQPVLHNGLCSACFYHKRYLARKADPIEREKMRERKRRWNKTPTGKANRSRVVQAYRQRLRDQGLSHTKVRKLRRYGITGYPQVTSCEVCKITCKTVLDHDHTNGKFRGFLCPQCNHALGNARDSILILQQLITYLQKHQQNQ